MVQKNRDGHIDCAVIQLYVTESDAAVSVSKGYEPEKIHPKGVVKVLKEDGYALLASERTCSTAIGVRSSGTHHSRHANTPE